MSDELLKGDFSWEMLGGLDEGRANLGSQMPVQVYRLFQYTIRSILAKRYGTEEMIQIFRDSGFLAGKEFAENVLDLNAPMETFVSQLQARLKELQIGILRFERFDIDNGKAILTIGEDLDCSGLPLTGECVCNYDEGFIAGILSAYTKNPYFVIEVDCWAKGDRVCRFEAKPIKK